MEPIKFPASNFTYSPNHEGGYLPLPVHKGLCMGFMGNTSCWELNDEEIAYIVKNRHIFIRASGEHQPPIRPFAQYLEFTENFRGHLVYYESVFAGANESAISSAWVLMMGYFEVPGSIMIDGLTLERSPKYKPKPAIPVNNQIMISPGDYVFRLPSPDEAHERSKALEVHVENLAETTGHSLTQVLNDIRANSLRLPLLIRIGEEGNEVIIG